MIFLLLPLLAWSSSVSAPPSLPAPGLRAYQNTFRVSQKRKVEVIYAFTEKGRARLEALRAEGHSCVAGARQTYRCEKHLPTENAAAEIAGAVHGRLAGSQLKFGERKREPALLAEGTSYEEWLVPQPVSFLGRDYAYYRYSILGGSLHKLMFGTPAEDGLVAKADGSFGYVTLFSRRESGEVFFLYLVEADYR